MLYSAVTFDTQTVRSNSFDFNGGLLHQLKVLRHEPVQVVLSEIVRSEILKHLTEHTLRIGEALETAIKRARDFDVTSITQPPRMDRTQAHAIATERLRDYLIELNATTLSTGDLTVRELMRRYFSGSAPFSSGKKDEFPDAVTLLSLEAWAKERDFKLLAISGDGDWRAFGDVSDHIDVVENISAALLLLNEQSDQARVIAGGILDKIDRHPNDEIHSAFYSRLSEALDNLDLAGEADSYYHAEADRVEITLNSFSFQGVDEFLLLEASEDLSEFVVELDAVIDVAAETNFYLSVYDSVDREFVSMGGTEAKRNLELETRLLVTIDRTEASETISKVEIIDAPSGVNFGEVEPDRSNDYYEEEQQETTAVAAAPDENTPF